ncbi:carboxypeptidase-like regulatory domain-containing protein [Hymenobacter weizhouensis]|uniref:carboxypeptidase-like regulatory domain-containing protein n=1 Tax=Hymenobacter sp. YIM 151500-1 TaxID=2987689 RepID=UPI00222606ED|nr:carboxypeptidase-like regulatory domain-containing protein [Hymenobacter sp. YIM 151500-1]UYZ64380.1 carboxypeptidase-like regulatory domain-containing protein [Hymenobacter sp. YIM 151500-1]
MDANSPTQPENENPTSPELNSDEENLSSGNGRLAIIVGAVLTVVVLGYVLLPSQATRRIAQTMPATGQSKPNATAARPSEETAATAPAAEPEATPEAAAAEAAEEKTEVARVAPAPAAPAPAASVAPEAAPAPEAAEEIVIEPVPAAPADAAPAPTVTLAGRVLDEEGRPLAGATVMIKGQRTGTGTDAKGNYKLEVPAGDNTVVYGYGGYEDQELRTRGSQTQNVTLVPRADAPRRRRR